MLPNHNNSPLKRTRGSMDDNEEAGDFGALRRSPREERSGFPSSAPAVTIHSDPAVTPDARDRSSRYGTPVSPRNEEAEEMEGRRAGGVRPLAARDRVSVHSAAFTNSSTRTSRSRASSHSVRPTPPPPLPIAAPTRSSSSSSYSDEEVEDETNEKDPRNHAEDVAKKYPMFTEAYAEKFRRDATPFLRVVESCGAGQPASTTAAAAKSMEGSVRSSVTGSFSPSLQSFPNAPGAGHREKHFVLYDTYVYEKTLGKGTFSKVVLGTASPSSTVLSNQISGDVPPRVALKVFRDKEEYIEACWDEFTILNSICVDPPTVTPEAVTAAMAASGHRHSSAAAASLPSPYISIRSVVMFTASTCGIKQQYFADQGRFVVPLGYVAHPVHPAIVFPVMGPTLLNVLDAIRQKSKEVTRASRHKRPRLEGAAPPAQAVAPRDFASRTGKGAVGGGAGGGQQAPSPAAAAPKPNIAAGAAETNGAPPAIPGQRRVYFRGLPLPLLKAVLYQMLTFLHFIHCRGVVHTDLKPENVLFESSKVLSVDVGIYYTHYTPHDSERRQQQQHATSGATGGITEKKKRSNDGFKLQSSSLEQRARRDDQAAFSPSTPPSHPTRPGTADDDKAPELTVLSLEGIRAAGSADTATTTVPIDVLPSHQDDITLAHYVRIAMPVMNSIRVMDLGAAQFLSTFRDHSLVPGYSHVPVSYNPIQTSHYRSPEVLLGFGWSTSADIFSLGCMIPELLTGDCLFMPNNTMEHLAMMQHVIGSFHDREGIRSGTATNLRSVFACNMRTFRHYFSLLPNNRDFELRWPVSRETVQEQAKQQRFAAHSSGKSEEEGLEALEETLPEDVEYVTHKPKLEEILAPLPDLLDLTRRMLHYHPFKRITAEEALQHPFFSNM